MNHYEILFIVHPEQSNQVEPLVEKYKELLTRNGGQIHREEDWGRRKLAYPIQKVNKGHYFLLNVECDPGELDELVESFRFNDSVLRHLILRTKGPPQGPSPVYKIKRREKEVV